jgi:glutathione S-transferase
VHQVHHPVGVGLYYEDQKAEAARFAEEFREKRMPKFLGWFERSVAGEWLAGDRWSYGDTSIFQLIEGLHYMFPKRMKAIEGDYPKLIAIRDRVAGLPGIHDYSPATGASASTPRASSAIIPSSMPTEQDGKSGFQTVAVRPKCRRLFR